MENRERIKEKIRKVLELAKNNPSKEESISASLKAQKLMMEYDIEMEEIEDIEELKELGEVYIDLGTGNKWKVMLAHVVAKNFRCKVYFNNNLTGVTFYGYKTDADIARNVYEFLFSVGNKLARKYANEYKKKYGTAKYVTNTYLSGYLTGVKEALDKQCVALMVIMPKEVEEGYTERVKGFKAISRKLTIGTNEKVKEDGVRAGRDTVYARQLDGTNG